MSELIKACQAVIEASEKATRGKSWLNLLQSNGCEIQLFERTHTVWLSGKVEHFKQYESDAEFIVAAANHASQIAKACLMMNKALVKIQRTIHLRESYPDVEQYITVAEIESIVSEADALINKGQSEK